MSISLWFVFTIVNIMHLLPASQVAKKLYIDAQTHPSVLKSILLY